MVREISSIKEEPQWMLDFRLKSLAQFYKMPMPQWGGDLTGLVFDDITYYVKPSERSETSWDEVPEEIRIRSISLVFLKQSRSILLVCLRSMNQKWFTTA